MDVIDFLFTSSPLQYTCTTCEEQGGKLTSADTEYFPAEKAVSVVTNG